jgi:hypothetical protein
LLSVVTRYIILRMSDGLRLRFYSNFIRKHTENHNNILFLFMKQQVVESGKTVRDEINFMVFYFITYYLTIKYLMFDVVNEQ